MKHITLLAAMAVAVGASAQRTVGTVEHINAPVMNFTADRAPTDTLIPASWLSGGSAALYTSSAGSYLVGTNSFGDLAKAQVFTSTGTVFVEELLFLFGAKNVGSGAGALVHARVYGLDGTGTNTADATVSNAPGTVLGNVDVPMSMIDTADFTIVTYNPAVSVTGNFGAGFDVSDLPAGVQLGLITTADGDNVTPDMNWEKFDDGSWVAMSNATDSWGILFDFGILAVIGDGVAGINDLATVNHMRMSFIGGNPANSSVIVAYEMLESADARLTVLDTKGAKVADLQLGRTAVGEHQTTLDVSSYSNGTYYVTIYANGNPLTKKLVVQH